MVDERKFEIWCEFLDNPYRETGELGRSWGRFGFCLDRTQLFQRIDADAPGWEGNLVYLEDWLKGGLWEKIESRPIGVSPWQGAIKYHREAESLLASALNVEQEDKALDMLDWISSQNIWNVGQGVTAPSIFFVALGDRVEIGWDREENYQRGFKVPPSDRVTIDLRGFKSEVDKFLAAYQQVVLTVKLSCI